jgi:hypothetical protein
MNKNFKLIYSNLVDNIPLWGFVFSYLVTVIIGNLLFLINSVENSLSVYSYIREMYGLNIFGNIEYWALLFLPFAIVPLGSVVTKRYLRSRLRGVNEIFTIDIGFIYFSFSILFASIVYSLYKSNALGLLFDAADAVAAVDNRFQLLGRLNFFEKILINSIVPLLSIICLIDFFQNKTRIKFMVTLLMVFFVSISLLMLNMKWPVLVYLTAIVCAIFCCESKKPYLYALIGMIFVALMYLAVSSFILRIKDNKFIDGPVSVSVIEKSTAQVNKDKNRHFPLLIFPLFRMAAIPPYYFEYKKREGLLCGGLKTQFKRGVACRPSTYIYGKIFPEDKFTGVGTAPSSTHITAYTLGGWSLSLLSMILISLILGFFSYFRIDGPPVEVAIKICGVVVGYHYSQLPFEGPIIYDHGFLWIGMFLFLMISLKNKWIQLKGKLL